MNYLRVTMLNGQWFLVPVQHDTTLRSVLKAVPEHLFLHPHELQTVYFFQPAGGDAARQKVLPLETEYRHIDGSVAVAK